MKQKTICPRCHRLRSLKLGERFCDGCLELRKQQEAPRRPIEDTVTRLRKDTVALNQLGDLEELASVPPERGGYHFSEWERGFIKALRAQEPTFTPAQRGKLEEIWHAADLRKRAPVDEKAQNLFSALSPERQAEQRARANLVRLPWEK